MLTITHTRQNGTLIEGTTRADGTGTILKANQWRWSPHLGTWYIPTSRDRAAKTRQINATAIALQAAGHPVEVTIDDTARPAAQVEADKIARQAHRAQALTAKAERAHAAVDAAYARYEDAAAGLPEGGEPIKVGHHSEHRHRRAFDHAWNTLGRAVNAQQEADDAARAAATAATTTQTRYNPVTVGNRIEKISAEIRRLERQLTEPVYDPQHGYRPATEAQKQARAKRINPRIAEERDNLTYWTNVRAEQITSGEATNYGPHNVAKGDAVKIRRTWARVARANPKTVSVETGYSWTDRHPWHEISDHRPAATE